MQMQMQQPGTQAVSVTKLPALAGISRSAMDEQNASSVSG